jgi:hypothetical protein
MVHNAVKLHTKAWLGISNVLSVVGIPDIAHRYYIMPILDG